MAGFTSKFISLAVTFPLEYMTTLHHANMHTKVKNLSHGFSYTMYRELLYSTCFWTIQENLYRKFRSYSNSDRKAYISSSFASSIISAFISYPFDLLKTWKISFPEKFINGSNSISVARTIVKERGSSFLFSGKVISQGIAPRIIRVGTGNIIFFSVYTKTAELLTAYKTKH